MTEGPLVPPPPAPDLRPHRAELQDGLAGGGGGGAASPARDADLRNDVVRLHLGFPVSNAPHFSELLVSKLGMGGAAALCVETCVRLATPGHVAAASHTNSLITGGHSARTASMQRQQLLTNGLGCQDPSMRAVSQHRIPNTRSHLQATELLGVRRETKLQQVHWQEAVTRCFHIPQCVMRTCNASLAWSWDIHRSAPIQLLQQTCVS